ncbi:MAG: hypothetical protein ROW52_03840 [Anaerolineaceae bacterium]
MPGSSNSTTIAKPASEQSANDITRVIGRFPYRMALAGGWIDQPFVSRHNPQPPGSMVVVSLQPQYWMMDRCGMANSTRKVALRLWPNGLPDGDPAELARCLYAAENEGKAEPSGSQDMIGLIYPGISRLDFDAACQGGVFPCHVETNTDPAAAAWLESVFYLIPVAPRPPGYSPLGVKNLDPRWIERLGRCGQVCFDAIQRADLGSLAAAMNESMLCWEAILPHTVRHPAIQLDLMGLLKYYQEHYAGAMYSGCGGGYLFVVSDVPVPGGARVKIRL